MKTHCAKGLHDVTAPNSVVRERVKNKDTGVTYLVRRCRACKNAYMAKYMATYKEGTGNGQGQSSAPGEADPRLRD